MSPASLGGEGLRGVYQVHVSHLILGAAWQNGCHVYDSAEVVGPVEGRSAWDDTTGVQTPFCLIPEPVSLALCASVRYTVLHCVNTTLTVTSWDGVITLPLHRRAPGPMSCEGVGPTFKSGCEPHPAVTSLQLHKLRC